MASFDEQTAKAIAASLRAKNQFSPATLVLLQTLQEMSLCGDHGTRCSNFVSGIAGMSFSLLLLATLVLVSGAWLLVQKYKIDRFTSKNCPLDTHNYPSSVHQFITKNPNFLQPDAIYRMEIAAYLPEGVSSGDTRIAPCCVFAYNHGMKPNIGSGGRRLHVYFNSLTRDQCFELYNEIHAASDEEIWSQRYGLQFGGLVDCKVKILVEKGTLQPMEVNLEVKLPYVNLDTFKVWKDAQRKR